VAVCFGDFFFDPASGTLLRSGRPVHLRPRASRLLEILLENPPMTVPKAELVQRLWPDAHVSAGSLPNLVLELRHALHDERDCALVRTVHGSGYAFVGETWEAAASPAATPGKFRLFIEGREGASSRERTGSGESRAAAFSSGVRRCQDGTRAS
jgi:DNA-binding winged helix-turn-helix (wHTH) protein